MSLESVKADILSQRALRPDVEQTSGEGAAKPKRHRRTKAEMEAYRQKKMAEEEARYLKAQQKAEKPKKTGNKAKGPVDLARKESPVKPKVKAASPGVLEPLYMLKIPGLPKGDCICVCYCRGAVPDILG